MRLKKLLSRLNGSLFNCYYCPNCVPFTMPTHLKQDIKWIAAKVFAIKGLK